MFLEFQSTNTIRHCAVNNDMYNNARVNVARVYTSPSITGYDISMDVCEVVLY